MQENYGRGVLYASFAQSSDSSKDHNWSQVKVMSLTAIQVRVIIVRLAGAVNSDCAGFAVMIGL